MMTWWAVLTFGLLALLSPAAGTDSFDNVAPTPLALPVAGAPLSFEQIEEISVTNSDGTSAIKELRSSIYRDGAGRLVIQGVLPPGANSNPSPYLDFIDPINRCRVFVLVNEGVGYRFQLPSATGVSFNFFSPENSESTNKLMATEKLGERTMEGIRFDGMRIEDKSRTESKAWSTREQWYSEDLKLLGSVILSSGNRTHTIRIQNLRHGESDPEIFRIPPQYKIIDQ